MSKVERLAAGDQLRSVGRAWEAAGMPQRGTLFDRLQTARRDFLSVCDRDGLLEPENPKD